MASFSELTGDHELIVNCTGLGARELAADDDVRPSRGQHVVIENPGLDGFFMEAPLGPEWAAYYVHGDRVLLGGVAEETAGGPLPSADVAAAIVERCARLDPRIAEARVLTHQVGWRPGRSAVRLEAEVEGGSHIVHNYGHGGSGVSLSWGCAHEAVRLLLS